MYISSQEELFYKLEGIVLWHGEHALECHHLGNRLAEEGWTLSTFANTHWIEVVCESNGEGLPYSIADESHLSMLVNDIWIFADLHRQNKQTAAVSSMLFITTSSQPCYCMKYKHKTIAPRPTEEFQTSASVFCSLVAKPRGQGPIVLYNQGYGLWDGHS